MNIYQSAQALGFFDVELRVQWLEAKGNPLSRLDAVIDWESFRPLLEEALAKPAKGPGGRPAHDPLKMFKLLVVQRYYNLSDEQAEYQFSDRLSFHVPRQRNSRADNATIKAGGVPEAWAETPAKPPQKDVDARWTKKNAEVHYGYKNPVKADAKSKLRERYAVTDASVHDSQKLAELVTTAEGEVYADRASRSAEAEAMLAHKQVTSHIHERAYRNRPLTDEQKESNRQKSKIRARIEPGFGFMSQSMKGFYLRDIGRRRNAAAIGLINLIYNLARYEQIVRLQLLRAQSHSKSSLIRQRRETRRVFTNTLFKLSV